ncbi:hypothetical protein M2338_002428 [Sphingobium sp. B2D3B]|nr:hypothetical protein [Sphingobium sp. B2D3B]MCW2396964.1 hypothetical protein [Sphingobium sp. B2D3C]
MDQPCAGGDAGRLRHSASAYAALTGARGPIRAPLLHRYCLDAPPVILSKLQWHDMRWKGARMGNSGLRVGALLLLASAGAAQSRDAHQGDFCARLAANIGVDKPASPDGLTTWTANAANFGQRFIFGGTVSTGLSVSPVEPATVEDYKRLTNMCATQGKGAICRLEGPLDFTFTWKGQSIVTPMEAEERAVVTVAGTRMTCQSVPSSPA